MHGSWHCFSTAPALPTPFHPQIVKLLPIDEYSLSIQVGSSQVLNPGYQGMFAGAFIVGGICFDDYY
jgi:hypothetical protein